VSFTTRAPRAGEVNGRDYVFISIEEFQQRRAQNDFFEWAEVHGNFYGTSRSWLSSQLTMGHDILLEIDWQGALQVKQLLPNLHTIFILPPSFAVLEQRLRQRGQDSEVVIQQRLAGAGVEIAQAVHFDYVIVNDDFAEALAALSAIIQTGRLVTGLQLQRHAELWAGLVDPVYRVG
jgi:guanylate kinase